MTILTYLLVIVLSQYPVYLARNELYKLFYKAGKSFGRICHITAQSCKFSANRLAKRNREVILIEDQLKNKHNFNRRYGRIRDAHIRDLALLPDYFRKVEDLILVSRDQKLSIKEVARLTDLTRRLEENAGKVLQKGYQLDQWIKRQKLDEDTTEHILSASVYRTVITTFLTVIISAAAVFVNFNLIALPMGELVPSDQLVAGVSVATISASVIVLLELVVGIFLLESMGITRLFGFDTMAPWQVKIIGTTAFLGLLFLATTEATLAVMREQIVTADAVLKSALAGSKIEVEHSSLPMYGQAALGFSLPWIIAMVGIPLELAVESSRQLIGRSIVFILRFVSLCFHIMSHGSNFLISIIVSILEIYISIPKHYFEKKAK